MNKIEISHNVGVRVQPVLSPVPANGRLSVMAGQSVKVDCLLVKGNPRPNIIWTRKSQPMPSGESSIKAEYIQFKNASRHHSGIYTCSADNGWSDVPVTANIRLDVKHKPEIQVEETFIHTRDGEEVEITCIVHASPVAAVEWYKNGQILSENDKIITKRGNRHTLLLQRIGEVDTHGKYQCRALNMYGEDMALTEVSGKAAPANFKSAPYVRGTEPTQYKLEWVVTSSSEVTDFKVEFKGENDIAWTSLAGEVDKVEAESYAGHLLLDNLSQDTKYVTRVSAKNSYGYSRFSPEFEFSTPSSQRETSSSLIMDIHKQSSFSPRMKFNNYMVVAVICLSFSIKSYILD